MCLLVSQKIPSWKICLSTNLSNRHDH